MRLREFRGRASLWGQIVAGLAVTVLGVVLWAAVKYLPGGDSSGSTDAATTTSGPGGPASTLSEEAAYPPEVAADRLAVIAIPELMEAAGLSHTYCAMIRRGAYVPHSRQWQTLRSLISPRASLSCSP